MKIEIDKIYNMDCVEGIKHIPDKSIDLVVTDPPYEFCDDGGGGCFGAKNREYHNQLKGIDKGIQNDILEQLFRVMKVPNIYIWCNKNQLRQYIDFFEERGCTTDLITWHKTNPVPTCNNKYLSDTEYCLFFRSNKPYFGGTYETKKKYYVTQTNKSDKEKYGHPTIKPLEIIRNFVINSSQTGGVILDPFMGSGTTAVASIKEKRHFIGFEINKEYYEKANERIRNEQSQLTLF